MDGSASEAQSLSLANNKVVCSGWSSPCFCSAKFARKITSISIQGRVVESLWTVRIRRLHDHVAIDGDEED